MRRHNVSFPGELLILTDMFKITLLCLLLYTALATKHGI